MLKNIAVFASGTGSNARRLIGHFQNSPVARVSLVVSNKPDAGVLDIAREYGVATQVIDRAEFRDGADLLTGWRDKHIDFIVLAGFLWLVPGWMVQAYPGRIVNIHPALLPKFGGKGFYGMRVHEAVLASGETESGITIHYVNEHYDAGDIIFQARCPVDTGDTPADLARKVQALEHRYFPIVVEDLISRLPFI